MFFGALLIFPVVVSLIKYRSKAKKQKRSSRPIRGMGNR